MLFGKRTFLGVAAKDEDGQALSDIRMTPGQKLEVRSAWSMPASIGRAETQSEIGPEVEVQEHTAEETDLGKGGMRIDLSRIGGN